jgi:hypothetical protein
MPVIPSTWDVEIRRSRFEDSPGKKLDSILTTTATTKLGIVVYL